MYLVYRMFDFGLIVIWTSWKLIFGLIMTSAREVRCTDTIEVESQYDHDNYEYEMPTYTSRDDRTYSLDETASSIVSDSTEGSTIDCNSKFH